MTYYPRGPRYTGGRREIGHTAECCCRGGKVHCGMNTRFDPSPNADPHFWSECFKCGYDSRKKEQP